MRLVLIAVGPRQPDWVDTAFDDYAKRLPAEARLELRTVKVEPRAGGVPAERAMAAEATRIAAQVPRGARRICLDERGTRLATADLAARFAGWKGEGRDVAFVVGGPDGLDPALLAAADERWRLSDLTLPHGLCRVLLAEALYRAWSVTAGHPYHRA